jgi:hypothetical protein
VSARDRRFSPVEDEEFEQDEAVPEAGSPVHEQRRRGCTTKAKDSRHVGARARGRA